MSGFGPLRGYLEKLYATATAIEELQYATTDNLPYEDWENLNECAGALRSYGNLIQAADRNLYLNERLKDAEQALKGTREEAEVRGWFNDD